MVSSAGEFGEGEDDATGTTMEELTRAEAIERMDALRTEIAYHDELYFKQSAPVISDGAYDQLKQELAGLLKKFPETKEKTAEPEDGMGDDRAGLFSTYRHRIRMLSLNKSYSEKELRAFDARVRKQLGEKEIDYVIEPKFDGLAISVTFEKGKLVRAVTRGNGTEGDDVTANVLTIRNLPHALRNLTSTGETNPVPAVIELRGEVYLSFAEFNRINRERESTGETPFAIPRNLAAGTLKQANPAEVASRKLEIVFYGVGGCEPAGARPGSQLALLHQLKDWGLPTIDAPRMTHGADAMWRAVQAVSAERPRLGYPIDGVVVKVDLVGQQDRLGVTPQAPLWAIAYKFVPERAETQLRAITLQVGRTGAITPVAELAPVRLGGSTITRASLFNADEIRRRDIRVGDFVYVEKAGEIVPAIASVNRARRTPGSEPFAFPTKCPACGGQLNQLPGEVTMRCSNKNCVEQIKRRIEHFASKECVGISGLGTMTIEKLVKAGKLGDVADIYRLRHEDLLAVNGGNEKSATRLLVAIDQSRHREFWRFISGLGIPGVGPGAAKKMAKHFFSFETMAVMIGPDWAGKQNSNPGLSDLTFRQVYTYFSSTENCELVRKFSELGVRP